MTAAARVSYSHCPACGRKGLYEPRDSRPGTTRCRYCKKLTPGPKKKLPSLKVAPEPKPKKKAEFGYELRKPCSNCPFRTDITPYIRTERAKEIVEGLSQGTFSCHKTVDYEALDGMEEDEVETRSLAGEKFCAGAMIMMHKQGRVGQMGRIAARLGMYNPDNLDLEAPVFGSSLAFIEAQIGGREHPDTDTEEEEHETCHCVGPSCEWPAGFMTGAGAVRGDTPPEALETCPQCGEYTCDSCFTTSKENPDQAICLDCAEWEEDEDEDDDGE